MIIAATSTFTLGRFTVCVRPRFDSPAWAVYIVYLGERLIGKQFSRPSLSDCQWLKRNNGTYATVSRYPTLEGSRGCYVYGKRGRPRT